MKRLLHASFFLSGLLCLLPGVSVAQPYSVSTDGSEVTDIKTGLIWRRCAEGMMLSQTVSGDTCTAPTGAVVQFTHEAALVRAASEAANTGVAWRLPNVKELASIVDKGVSNPAIDGAAFPTTPASYFFSATPDATLTYIVWIVSFNTGSVSGGNRSVPEYVRLVRAGQ